MPPHRQNGTTPDSEDSSDLIWRYNTAIIKARFAFDYIERCSTKPNALASLGSINAESEGRLEKFARWFGLRKSSPNVSAQHSLGEEEISPRRPLPPSFDPPVIVRTSPNELTPASGDELL